MIKHLKALGKHTAFLLAVAFAAAAGGVTTAVVSAAIPDSNTTIHGCYGKLAGNLRVIDTDAGKTCNAALENNLNWNGGSADRQAAYAALNSDGTLNTTFSEGVNNIKLVPYGPDEPQQYLCFNVSFTPKAAFSSQEGMDMHISAHDSGSTNDICGSGYNAVAIGGVAPGQYTNPSYSFFN
jgi:hypothetical protein